MKTNDDLYSSLFRKALGLDAGQDVSGIEYQGIPEWDSVGHMSLVAALEEEFKVELDIDDVIDLDSFSTGKQILQKYGVTF